MSRRRLVIAVVVVGWLLVAASASVVSASHWSRPQGRGRRNARRHQIRSAHRIATAYTGPHPVDGFGDDPERVGHGLPARATNPEESCGICVGFGAGGGRSVIKRSLPSIAAVVFFVALASLASACGGDSGAGSDEEAATVAGTQDQPDVGDCFNDLGEGETEIVSCRSDHDYEVWALSSSPEGCTEGENQAALTERMEVYEGDVRNVKLEGLYRARWEYIVCAFSDSNG